MARVGGRHRPTHPFARAGISRTGGTDSAQIRRTLRAVFRERPADKTLIRRAPSSARTAIIDGSKPFAPVAGEGSVERVEPIEQDVGGWAGFVPAAEDTAPAQTSVRAGKAREMETTGGWSVIEKTLTWFRHATAPHRPPLD